MEMELHKTWNAEKLKRNVDKGLVLVKLQEKDIGVFILSV